MRILKLIIAKAVKKIENIRHACTFPKTEVGNADKYYGLFPGRKRHLVTVIVTRLSDMVDMLKTSICNNGLF
jgi:hypothetical protein